MAGKIGIHVTKFSKYERSISVPSLEITKKIADALEMSLDKLEKALVRNADNEFLNLNKILELSDDQKKTVKDLLSTFLLKSNLRQQLI